MNVSALDRLSSVLKGEVYQDDLAYRVATHEAGHVMAARRHGRAIEVVLPALTDDRRYVASEMQPGTQEGATDITVTMLDPDSEDPAIILADNYTATKLPVAGLGDDAVIDICLSGYCSERCLLETPTYEREPYRSARDCSILNESLRDASVLLPAIDAAMGAGTRSAVPPSGFASDHARLACRTVFESSRPDKIGQLVLAIMNSPIGVAALERITPHRVDLVDLADALFERWQANDFRTTRVTLPLN